MSAYENMTDEELIEALRAGDESIMDYILDKYKPLVRKKAVAFFLIGGDTDDLMQEGMIGLFKAIRDYRDDKESSFFHFAEICIERQLIKAVESSNRKKHAPLNGYVSFYQESGEEGKPLSETLPADAMDDPEQRVLSLESSRQLLNDARDRLSAMEMEVLECYLSGMDYRQIAEQLGKTPKAIDNALSRLKIKLRNNMD